MNYTITSHLISSFSQHLLEAEKAPATIEKYIRDVTAFSKFNRGVEDIFIVCTDNLTGFSAAIEAVYPQTEIQNCIIHQIRDSTKYVSYKDLKMLMADLKAVYAAVDEDAALVALDTFAEHWDGKYPKISASWRKN